MDSTMIGFLLVVVFSFICIIYLNFVFRLFSKMSDDELRKQLDSCKNNKRIKRF
jgi:mannitol/fructose-specific phosphotransferase system IIA component (Ntr-type)